MDDYVVLDNENSIKKRTVEEVTIKLADNWGCSCKTDGVGNTLEKCNKCIVWEELHEKLAQAIHELIYGGGE